MYTKLYSVVLTLFVFANVFAQDLPVQKIVGAEEVIELGELVVLSLSPIEKAPVGYVKHVVDWKVFDYDQNTKPSLFGKQKSFRAMPDGSIFFGAGVVKKKLTVFASVAYLYVSDKKEASVKTVLLTAIVDIGGGSEPEPDPDPPAPEPTFPDGKYQLSAFSYKLAHKHVPAHAKKAAGEIVQSHRGIMARVASGTLGPKLDEILVATTESNNKALSKAGVSYYDWEMFFVALQDRLYDLYKQKAIVNKDDIVKALDEVAIGLEKVK